MFNLPIFINESEVDPNVNENVLREIEIYPLGSSEKLMAMKSPMYIQQNSSFGLWGTLDLWFLLYLGH